MNEGRIIEYIDQGRFVCTLCLQDRGNRLHLLTRSNRLINLSPKRAILISGSTIDILRPREELLEKLNQAEEARNRLKGRIDVRELWELTKDENQSFDHKYLAHLVFGESIDDEHISAVVRALFENHLHFKMKEGRFHPNSEERVNLIIKQKEEEALKEEWLIQGSAWLKDVQAGRATEDPRYREDIINLLIQLTLFGKEVPDFKYGKELLSRAGISDIRESRNLLIRLGVWEEDENLDLLRLGIETTFTKDQLDESARLAESKIDFEGRQDLRQIPALTIDGPLTRDFDDALSLEISEDTLDLGIHIADVAAFILQDSILDRTARERASSLYMPRRQIPMLPPDLSHDTLSLKQGCDRQAISLSARFDKTGRLLDYSLAASVVRVQDRLTYDEVNEMLRTDDGPGPIADHQRAQADILKQMYELSRILHNKRVERGALMLSLPELHFKFEADSSPSLEIVDQNTPSRMIVAEFMILYNCLIARFCRDNRIPVLFRTQEEPGERLTLEESGYLYYVFQQRRKLRRLKLNTAPDPHSVLGLDVYVQGTSPIRRYLDLVVQRQIKGFLMGVEPVCNEKQLEEIGMTIEPVIKSLGTVKRNRLRYWVLKFLSLYPGGKYRAVVLDEFKRKYRIVLKDFFLVAEIRRQNGIIIKPGEEILVEVKNVDPWEDSIELALSQRVQGVKDQGFE
jgi:exoribonuclease-2